MCSPLCDPIAKDTARMCLFITKGKRKILLMTDESHDLSTQCVLARYLWVTDTSHSFYLYYNSVIIH